MKKILSILFALFIVLSGMHLSMATHICGGEVADVKWSFTGEKASCGMEEDAQADCPIQNSIASNCCHNEMSVYSVDNTYNPSTFQLNSLTHKLLHVFAIPVNLHSISLTAVGYTKTNVNPPNGLLASAVSLADICVFRI